MTVTNQMTGEEAWTLTPLESLLEDGSALVHRRKKAPANEKEFQNIMEDYLRVCFSFFDPKPKIPGTIKNFEPDCGVISVHAAIEFKLVHTEFKLVHTEFKLVHTEFKLVHTEQEARVAYSGVIEDTAGYKAAREWTRFYAVMYQKHTFLPKSHMKSDVRRVGALEWTPILLNGKMTQRVKKRAARGTAPEKAAKKATGK